MASSPKKWKSFAALVTTPALIFLDQTILPVALPIIQHEFNATSTQLQWCINSYLLAIAIIVLVGGKLSNLMGHRRALILGITGFAIFSAFCGLSANVEMLIVSRALQGMSEALTYSALPAMVAHVFPAHQRGRILGFLVSVGALFSILGPLVGGYVIEVASWRWIFWINLPITAVGLCLMFRYLPSVERGKGKIDLIGFGFFAIGTATLGIFLMQAADWGWDSTKTYMLMGLSFVMLFLLFLREKKSAYPFLDLVLFKFPIFSAININVAIMQFILMIVVFQTIYFEKILGYSPFNTGLIFSAAGSPTLLMSPIGGWLSDKCNPRLPIAIGYLLLIFSLFLFAFFSIPPLTIIFISFFCFGSGIAFILTPSYSAALSSVPTQKLGVAMGIISTSRMIGGMIGLALIHLFTSIVQAMQAPLVGDRLAYIKSFSRVHFALAFLVIAAFAITSVLHQRKSAHHLPPSPGEGWD